MRVLTGILIGLLASSGAALADSSWKDSAVLQSAGLDGRWALDCNRPAGKGNEYLVYLTPENGVPTEQVLVDASDAPKLQLLDVRLLKNGDLQWVRAEGEVMINFVIQLKGNKMRTWSSASSDGHAFISKAKSADGKAVPWFSKCETN